MSQTIFGEILQEIVDAENSLKKAKTDLTQVMAKEMQETRECERLKKEIAEHEGYAAQALSKGKEDLALEIAQKIADHSGFVFTRQKHVGEKIHDQDNYLFYAQS